MAKYVFLNVPGHGHVNPTLAVVRELVMRGEEVIYYLTEEFRAAVEATGAVFRPYSSLITQMRVPANFSMTDKAQSPLNMLPMRMADEGLQVIPQIIDDIRSEQPDYIIYDMMCIWGKVLALSLHIPAILFRPSYALNEHMNMQRFRDAPGFASPEVFMRASAHLAELCRRYDVEPFGMQEMFMGSEPLTIVFIPREFQPMGETFDERFVFVGPSIAPRPNTSDFPLEKLDGQKVLLISLGTVFNNQAQFFNKCFAAFKDKSWLVVLSRGKNVDPADLDPLPENFLVAPYVPQLEVLQRASAFITHGGMNSTMESLYYGVPMVAVPQMVEQAMTASRVNELGLGIALDKEQLTVEGLREAAERVMDDPAYRERVQKMQKHVRNAGGYKRAADAIMEYTHTHLSSVNS